MSNPASISQASPDTPESLVNYDLLGLGHDHEYDHDHENDHPECDGILVPPLSARGPPTGPFPRCSRVYTFQAPSVLLDYLLQATEHVYTSPVHTADLRTTLHEISCRLLWLANYGGGADGGNGDGSGSPEQQPAGGNSGKSSSSSSNQTPDFAGVTGINEAGALVVAAHSLIMFDDRSLETAGNAAADASLVLNSRRQAVRDAIAVFRDGPLHEVDQPGRCLCATTAAEQSDDGFRAAELRWELLGDR